MALTTVDALAHPGLTVYRGPCSDRLSLRDARAAGMLVFSLNRSFIGLRMGEQSVFGFFDTLEEAVAARRQHPEYDRLSAHHRGWGDTEECLLLCSYWKPLGGLI